MQQLGAPLGRLLPGLGAVSNQSVDETRLKLRSRNVLLREGVASWGDLAIRSPGDLLTWQNAGAVTVRDVVGACVDVSAEAIAFGYGVRQDTETASATGDEPPAVDDDDLAGSPTAAAVMSATRALRVLAAWAAGERNATRIEEVLDEAQVGGPPPDIARALATLNDLDPALLAPRILQRPPDALITDLMELLGPGQQTVFQRRLVDQDATLEEVVEMGVTRERVRQLQVAADHKVTMALKEERFLPIQWRAWDLALVLGRAAPSDSPITERGLDHALRGSNGQARRVLQALVLKLAGTYRERQGWLVRGDLPAVRAEELVGLADQHGLIAMDRAGAWLDGQGIGPAFQEAWIVHSGRFRRESEMLLVWTRGAVEKCVALLALHKRPMDAETLLDLVGEGHNVRGIRARLFEDRRLMRGEPSTLGATRLGSGGVHGNRRGDRTTHRGVGRSGEAHGSCR